MTCCAAYVISLIRAKPHFHPREGAAKLLCFSIVGGWLFLMGYAYLKINESLKLIFIEKFFYLLFNLFESHRF